MNEVKKADVKKEKTTGVYRIAGYNFLVKSVYPGVHALCREYQTDGEPDFHLETTREDIAYEQQKSAQNDLSQNLPVQHYSDTYLEQLAVYRKIAEIMPSKDTILFHGSVIAVDGEAYIFTAKSGTGKSTHTRLWREMLGGRAVMINDDKPMIRVSGNEIIVYGTPWNGKHHLGTNASAPVRAICLLERAEENQISPVPKKDAMPVLIRQTYRPSDPAMMIRSLQLLADICNNVKLYRLGCNMNPEAAELSFKTMREG